MNCKTFVDNLRYNMSCETLPISVNNPTRRYDIMNQEIQVIKPKVTFDFDVPESEQTVKAFTLLSEKELQTFREKGAALIISVDGKFIPVLLHSDVPAQATAVRDTQGNLWGIPAVAGG